MISVQWTNRRSRALHYNIYMRSAVIKELAREVVSLLQERSLTIATAESCTGGSIAAAITSVAGCSSVMLGGVVAYHNDVKVNVLGVNRLLLDTHGAVSEPVVEQMACGVSKLTGARCAVATSGVAGPGGGTAEKPVGTVWVALRVDDKVETHLLNLGDEGREANIDKCVGVVLGLLRDILLRQ